MCKRPYVSKCFLRFKVKFRLVSQGQTEEHRNQGMITLHYLDQNCSLSQLDMKLTRVTWSSPKCLLKSTLGQRLHFLPREPCVIYKGWKFFNHVYVFRTVILKICSECIHQIYSSSIRCFLIGWPECIDWHIKDCYLVFRIL